jgi:ABC-type Na+ efflux pump permease subunit
MKKLLAVIKREYIQRVRTKFFVIATILGPIMMAAFTVVPGMMMVMRTGGPTRIAVVDQTGKTYIQLARELEGRSDRPNQSATPGPVSQPAVGPGASQEQMKQAGRMMRNNMALQQVSIDNRSLAEVKQQLASKIQNREIDGYVILPPDLIKGGRPNTERVTR